MKQLAYAAGLLLAAVSVSAQTAPASKAPSSVVVAAPPASELRKLIEQPNKVVVTRRRVFKKTPLAGGALEVSAIGAFEPGREDERLLGVRIDLDHPSLAPADRTHYLDLHEVEELLRAIDLLEQVAAEGGKGHRTEADFETIEGLRVGVWVDEEGAVYWAHSKRSKEAPIHVSGRLSRLAASLQAARENLFND